MSTINSHETIKDLIKSNGYFADDPRVAFIVEYETSAGQIAWGVTWQSESETRQRRYMIPSIYVRNPRVIWSAENG